jgi:hypothetical protein
MLWSGRAMIRRGFVLTVHTCRVHAQSEGGRAAKNLAMGTRPAVRCLAMTTGGWLRQHRRCALTNTLCCALPAWDASGDIRPSPRIFELASNRSAPIFQAGPLRILRADLKPCSPLLPHLGDRAPPFNPTLRQLLPARVVHTLLSTGPCCTLARFTNYIEESGWRMHTHAQATESYSNWVQGVLV